MKLIILSGRSGSGKSTALQQLEDLGFYCIDNLPASLLPDLIKSVNQNDGNQDIAVGIITIIIGFTVGAGVGKSLSAPHH